MSDTSVGNTQQLMEQPNGAISKVMEQLSLSTENSDETSTPPKNLSDMPVDVVGLIIKKSDYREKLILRKTSKSLRTLVDKQQPTCTLLEVSCKDDCIICNYNDHCVAYVSPTWDRVDFLSKYQNCRLDEIILATDYEKVAFDDLAFTLKNPKLQLETFLFDSYCDEGACCVNPFENNDNRNGKTNDKHVKMQSILKSINHQLSVKACTIDILSFSSDMPILSYLKPGILQKITIFSAHSNAGRRENSEIMQQVELLDQWKEAKELELECGFNEWFPVKHVTHFKRFHFEERYIYPENLIPIRDFISEHENIEFCSILTFIDLFAKYFDDIVGPAVSPNLYHYTIPDSEYYLVFVIRDNLLTIEKKKK